MKLQKKLSFLLNTSSSSGDSSKSCTWVLINVWKVKLSQKAIKRWWYSLCIGISIFLQKHTIPYLRSSGGSGTILSKKSRKPTKHAAGSPSTLLWSHLYLIPKMFHSQCVEIRINVLFGIPRDLLQTYDDDGIPLLFLPYELFFSWASMNL